MPKGYKIDVIVCSYLHFLFAHGFIEHEQIFKLIFLTYR